MSMRPAASTAAMITSGSCRRSPAPWARRTARPGAGSRRRHGWRWPGSRPGTAPWPARRSVGRDLGLGEMDDRIPSRHQAPAGIARVAAPRHRRHGERALARKVTSGCSCAGLLDHGWRDVEARHLHVEARQVDRPPGPARSPRRSPDPVRCRPAPPGTSGRRASPSRSSPSAIAYASASRSYSAPTFRSRASPPFGDHLLAVHGRGPVRPASGGRSAPSRWIQRRSC